MSYVKCYASRSGWNKFQIDLWDEEGHQTFEWKNPAWQECHPDDADSVGLSGESLKKIYNWRRDDTTLHFQDMKPYQKFLIERYGTDDSTSKHQKRVFFDIEVEMGDALTVSYIESAPKPVTSVAFYLEGKYDIFILDREKQLSEVEGDRAIYPCKSERELLLRVLYYIRDTDPDILIGWNSDFFDIPYLYWRMVNVLGKEYADKLSPIGLVKTKKEDEYFRRMDMYVDIVGIESLDYMRLHKNYYWREEPSYSLDKIGKKYVDLGKVEYSGNLDDLFRDDVEKFIQYNFRDVEIMVKLDEKFQYIDLTINLSHKGKHNYSEVYQNSVTQDGAISAYLLSQGIIPPSRDRNPISKQGYAGGYTWCPEAGLYRYMFDEDLTSLFPCVIMSLNMGKETYSGRIIDPNNDRNNRLGLCDLKEMAEGATVIWEAKNLKRSEVSVSRLIDIIEKGKYAISANGVVFDTSERSTLHTILDKWYDERVIYKKRKKEARAKGDREGERHWHLMQYTIKILLNSTYGVSSMASWRYGMSHAILGEAVTLSGNRVIQESAYFANNHMNERMGEVSIPPMKELEPTPEWICKPEHYSFCRYIDTDSNYYNAEPLLLHLYPDYESYDTDKKIELLEELAMEYQNLINEHYDTMSAEVFNLPAHRFQMKTEVIIMAAYFRATRRYAQWIVKEEGQLLEKLDIKGLEYMKVNFPPVFAEFFNDIVKRVLKGDTEKNILSDIKGLKQDVMDGTISLEQLANPTAVRTMQNYIGRRPRAGTILTEVKKGAMAPIRGAIYHNDLVRFWGVEDARLISQSDKVKWIYLKDNPYKINVLSFVPGEVCDRLWEFMEENVDRKQMFETVMLKKLGNFFEDMGWTLSLNPYINAIESFEI